VNNNETGKREKKSGRVSKKSDESELAAKYAVMTAKELAEEYGVAEITVRRWIAHYRNLEKNQQPKGGKREKNEKTI
jgi:transposase